MGRAAPHRLTLAHPGGRSEVLIGPDLLAGELGGHREWVAGRTVFLLSTPRLRELHGPSLVGLGRDAARLVELGVEDGEGAKTLDHAGRLWREMLTAGGKRSSRLVTVGGGTVGDLGGFVAGCFLRGIEYVQVPTTLLAQVDAAVGGKTGIDLPGGKNTVGLFHHPRRVLMDTALLGTLPPEELRSGLAEVVKMAALLDPPLFEAVEARLEALMAGDAGTLAQIVAGAAAAKCKVVERDPAEGDYRRILNFGHTLGHAIEGVLAYRRLRHGEAVAYGLLFALRLARAHWHSASSGPGGDLAPRLRDLLRRLELPPLPPLDAEELWSFMARDKKVTEGGLVWVLPRAFGRGEMVAGISSQLVLETLQRFLDDPWAV